VIRGRLNKQIAAHLDIAEQTVKQHRGRVMEKIGVRSVPELVRVCEATGLFAAMSIRQRGTRRPDRPPGAFRRAAGRSAGYYPYRCAGRR